MRTKGAASLRGPKRHERRGLGGERFAIYTRRKGLALAMVLDFFFSRMKT